jgi:acetyltransferase-like isoleucine patch superfamily enzyme
VGNENSKEIIQAFMKILRKYLKKPPNYSFEDPVQVDKRTKLTNKSFIGRFSYIGKATIMGDIHIGRFCSIANGFSYYAGDHDMKSLTTHPFIYSDDMFGQYPGYKDIKYKQNIKYQDAEFGSLKIGNDCWLGADVTVLKGCSTIGDGAIIGARSVVTKDVPPYSISVGGPAKVIKFRFDEGIVARLLRVKWWKFDLSILKDLDFSDVEKCLKFLESQDE